MKNNSKSNKSTELFKQMIIYRNLRFSSATFYLKGNDISLMFPCIRQIDNMVPSKSLEYHFHDQIRNSKGIFRFHSRSKASKSTVVRTECPSVKFVTCHVNVCKFIVAGGSYARHNLHSTRIKCVILAEHQKCYGVRYSPARLHGGEAGESWKKFLNNTMPSFYGHSRGNRAMFPESRSSRGWTSVGGSRSIFAGLRDRAGVVRDGITFVKWLVSYYKQYRFPRVQ